MVRFIFCPLGGALVCLMPCTPLEAREGCPGTPWPLNMALWWSGRGWEEVLAARVRWPPPGPALEKLGSAGGRNLQALQRRTPGSHLDCWPARHVAEQHENKETVVTMTKCVNSALFMSSCWLWANTALHERSCELVSGPAIPQRITSPYGGAGVGGCLPKMKRPLIYLKQSQWEVAFHPLHHLSRHDSRKASFKVQSGGTETGEDHYEPINSLFTGPPCFPARGRSLGLGGWEGAIDVNLKVQQGYEWAYGLHRDPFHPHCPTPNSITHDARTNSSNGMLHKWIRCSGPLCVLPGVMGKKLTYLFTALAGHRGTATGTLVLFRIWKHFFYYDNEKRDRIISTWQQF